MKAIKVTKNFTMDNEEYIPNDEIQVKEMKDLNKIAKLNELGYIEPLSREDLILMERELLKGGKE